MMRRMTTAVLLLGALSAIPTQAQTEIKGQISTGAEKNAMCIGCHGIAGYQVIFPEQYRVPMISGQSEKYIYNALQAYKKSERKHPTMRAIAVSLSDQDMADLAAFYAHNGKTATSATTPK